MEKLFTLLVYSFMSFSIQAMTPPQQGKMRSNLTKALGFAVSRFQNGQLTRTTNGAMPQRLEKRVPLYKLLHSKK